MPNLATELEQLALADKHVRGAEESIERMRRRVDRERLRGADTTEFDRALQASIDSLAVFIEHRALIARTIEDIRAGRLPST
jgi:hypothetical protein